MTSTAAELEHAQGDAGPRTPSPTDFSPAELSLVLELLARDWRHLGRKEQPSAERVALLVGLIERLQPRNRLFVARLPYELDVPAVDAWLRLLGVAPTHVHLVLNRRGGSRGVAFVDMASPEAALGALARLQGAELGGRQLTIRMARPLGAPGAAPLRQSGLAAIRRSRRRSRRRSPPGSTLSMTAAPRRSP